MTVDSQQSTVKSTRNGERGAVRRWRSARNRHRKWGLRFPSPQSLAPSHQGLCENPALSPLGERVPRDGVFISRRGSGVGVPARINYLIIRGFHTDSLAPTVEEFTDADKHLLKHRRREPAGLGILLAGMVGTEESRQAARQRETRAVGKLE